jgi:hypothetical protein
MKNSDHKLWPYKPKVSIILTVILLIVLILITAVLRSTIGWPPEASTNMILIGIFLMSLLPVLLAILDLIIDKGGSIGYKDFKIDFGKVQQSGLSGFTIPANIGVPGMAVTDSGTSNILETLKLATSTGIVIVDLEDGHAWWETRLLVLVSGAVRLRKPDKIVFVANEEGKQHVFQGWAEPEDLLQQLLNENQQYLRSFYASTAAAKQWELYGPLEMIPPNSYYQVPPPPVWVQNRIATNHSWMAFSNQTGLPNELLTEQYLQNELGNEIEQQPGGSKHINIVRLNEIFKPVLIKQAIDMTWSNEKQTNAFFTNDACLIAITENGRYSAMVSIQTLFNEALKSIFGNKNNLVSLNNI